MKAAGAGALLGLTLFAIDLLGGQIGFMGLDDPRVIAEVMRHARLHAVEQQLLVLLTLVMVGAGLGALGGAWARRRKVLGGVTAVLLGHGYFFLRSLLEHPQLYSGALYDRGGWPATAMTLATDHLSARALDLAMLLVVAALLWRRPRAAIAVAAAAWAAVGWLLIARAPVAATPHDKRNVLLIAVDSLRADRLDRFTAMSQLAQRGVRFRQAYVTQARTFPSFVSLLTGRLPTRHGIRHEFPTAAARAAIGPSLPSLLRQSGWRTAVVSDFSGEIFSRTAIGFDDIDVPRLDLFTVVGQQILTGHVNVLPYATSFLGQRIFPSVGIMAEFEDPAALGERAQRELDRLASGPFFLTVFFSAPHTPYASSGYARFAEPDYRGPYRYLKQPLPMLPALPTEEARQVQALYDGAVATTDDAIARLLRRLDEDGLTASTIVVLLGDHGENLFDVPGRGMGHGDHLWGDLANHIPLVIADGKSPPHEVNGIVRDIDLTPTLAALLGVSGPAGDGVDLSPLLRDEKSTLELDSFEETGLWLLQSGPGYRREDRLPYPDLWHSTEAGDDGDVFLQPRWEQPVIDAKVRALRTARWKLVYQPAPDGVHWRLFDLDNDDAQRLDVAAEHPAEVAELRRRLEPFIR